MDDKVEKLKFKFAGTLLLGGGGSDEVSAKFDSEFAQRVPKSDARILYVPIAWSTDPATYSECLAWFSKALHTCGISSAKVTMAAKLDGAEVRNLLDFDAIYIGGGNTYNLLQSMKNSNFGLKISEFLTAGKTVYGGSAGAIVMAKSIRSVAEENQLGPNVDASGFGLVGQYSIRCHFTASDIPLIESFLLSEFPSPLIAIPESAGLVVDSRGIRVAGTGSVAIFESGRPPTQVASGEFVNWA